MSGGVIVIPGLGLVGLALLVLGFHGRRVDDHPHCRRCKFDLFGSLPQATACPECGANLTRPRSIKQGQRKKRWGWLLAGILFVFPSLAGLGLMTLEHLDKQFVYQHAPVIYLFWTLHDDAARDELHDRMNQSALNKQQITQLVDHALAMQANKAIPWDEAWGEIIEDAHVAGHVTEARLHEYVMQSIDLEFVARQRVQRGRLAYGYVRVTKHPARVGGNTVAICTAKAQSLTLDDQLIDTQPLPRQAFCILPRMPGHDRERKSRLFEDWPMETATASLGIVNMQTTVDVKIAMLMIQGKRVAVASTPSHHALSGKLQIVEALQGRYIREELSLDEQARRAAVGITTDAATGSRYLTLNLIEQPDRQSNLIWFRVDGRLVPQGTLLVSNGGFDRRRWKLSGLYSEYINLSSKQRLDIIVRPNIDYVESHAATAIVWLGQWVFKDVPLDTEPIFTDTQEGFRQRPLPTTTVKPQVRYLTFEEADGPPRIDEP